MRTFVRVGFGAVLLVFAAACARRLNGPPSGGPSWNMLALRTAGVPAADIAKEVRAAQSTLVIVFAPADSAWFADLAKQTSLVLSRSKKPNQGSIAFLATKPEGDTTISLGVTGSKPLLVHDALYKFDKTHLVDLLGVRVESATSARGTVHSLLGYIASDVQGDAAIILAIDAASPALTDSLGVLLRPALLDVRDCFVTRRGSPPPGKPDILVFYGPEARMGCSNGHTLPLPGAPIVARMTLPR
jgi:hypothetical protein